MDLRRALLLFAIVLGLAAIASSITRQPESDSPSSSAEAPRSAGAPRATDAPPSVSPAAGEMVEVKAGARPRTVRVAAGRPTTLIVSVKEPAQVEIPDLGLVEDGDRLTPARFELLVADPGRYAVRARPASAAAGPIPLATLVVAPARHSGPASP